MAATNQVAGNARVKVDGQLLETAGDVVLKIGGKKREEVKGDFSAGAFKETTEPAMVEFSELVKGRTRFDDFDSATVTVEFDTGQMFVVREAWVMDPAEITTSDGKAKRSICGQPAEEVL